MANFQNALYQRVKSIMKAWHESDIYAISFFVNSNEAFEYNGFSNISTFAVSYNTEKDCRGAGMYDEERWNYAFWRHDATPVIDPDVPDSLIGALFDWYEENGIANIGYEDYKNCYDSKSRYIGKGPIGHYELLCLVTETAKRLQEEGFAEEHFKKKLPIIVHGLEYAWYDIEATRAANVCGEADVFLEAMQKLGIIP